MLTPPERRHASFPIEFCFKMLVYHLLWGGPRLGLLLLGAPWGQNSMGNEVKTHVQFVSEFCSKCSFTICSEGYQIRVFVVGRSWGQNSMGNEVKTHFKFSAKFLQNARFPFALRGTKLCLLLLGAPGVKTQWETRLKHTLNFQRNFFKMLVSHLL